MRQALAVLVLALAGCASHAQQAQKPARVGLLSTAPAVAIETRVQALREGLRALGYAEGTNLVLEPRHPAQPGERLAPLAADLVRKKVDVIVTTGPAATRAARDATSAIPIVMAFDTDPVGSKLAASLARPGGNVTGLSTLAPEASGKQVEILREVFPRLSRIAVLGTSKQAGTAQALRAAEGAALRVGMDYRYVDVPDAKALEPAFQTAVAKLRVGAMIVVSGPLLDEQRARLVELAAKHRLPVIYPLPEYAEAGGLMSYGASPPDLFRRAATYVDRILKGARPGDLAIQQPTKFDLVVNQKTAKALGIVIPRAVLMRAERVIE